MKGKIHLRAIKKQDLKRNIQRKVLLIPSLITVIGIFLGFLSILQSFKGNFDAAIKYMAFAVILDGLDGRIARKLNASSEFGKEFDSLSDLVAFGVAPAVLVYSWAFGEIADQFGMLVSFSLVVCGAFRLAKFNIDTKGKKHFSGLPIPAAAASILSIVYFHPEPLNNIYSTSIMILYTLSVAFLMVSPVTYFSLKHLKLTSGNMKINLLMISTLIALIWYHSRIMLLLISVTYLISGPIALCFRKIKN